MNIIDQPAAATQSLPNTSEAAAPSTDPGDDVTGFEGSFRLFVAEAGLVTDAVTFRGNAMVAFHNARRGVLAVLAAQPRFAADPDAPRLDVARVERTTRAAEALVYATRRASQTLSVRSDVTGRTSEVYALREMLLSNADAAVKSRALPASAARDVETIHKGHGAIDAAQDCIDLAAFFDAHAAALGGRTFVTAQHLRDARAQGSALLHLLRPSGVEPLVAGVDPVADAAALRDRMAVVLARHYDYVARLGGWLWGLDVAAHVPPLRSRTVATTSEDVDDSPTPPVVPA